MSRQRNFAKTGFTLVEILVVLGIVFLLAAILFAVFARAREKGGSAVCQSNLKQLALSFQQYVQDSDGVYPSNGGGIEKKEWYPKISPYVQNTQIFTCPTRIGLSNNSIPNYDFHFFRLNNREELPVFFGRNEAATVNASKTWLLMDKRPPPWGEVYIEASPGCGWWGLNWGETLHSGGANYAFVDGHVKWLTQEQIAEIECSLGEPKFIKPSA